MARFSFSGSHSKIRARAAQIGLILWRTWDTSPSLSNWAWGPQPVSMNRMREFDITNAVATVEAGVILETLQQRAAEAGLFFPVSLAAEGSCQIGGTIATNAPAAPPCCAMAICATRCSASRSSRRTGESGTA